MSIRILVGDCRASMATLPPESAQTCVTSPPYWGLRDYGVDGQLGLEETPEEYVAGMVAVFREVRRVLRDDGTLWLNLGDSYANDGKWGGATGGKHVKALHGDSGAGRGKRNTGLKPNPMPESVTDRPTKSHEYVFLLSKSERYAYDAAAIRESDVGSDHARTVLDGQPSLEPSGGLRPTHRGIRTATGRNGDGRNARTVWSITTQPFSGAHFATMPPALAERCILAGCPEGLVNVVLDPFGGAGTTGLVAQRLGRSAVLCELNPEYAALAADRIREDAPMLSAVSVGGAA